LGIIAAALEAPAVVSGFDDVAVVSEAIEQRGRHLGVGEDARPFAEGEIGGDDDRGALVEPADEVEQELAAGPERKADSRARRRQMFLPDGGKSPLDKQAGAGEASMLGGDMTRKIVRILQAAATAI